MIFRGLSKDFQRVFREFLNDYKGTKIISLIILLAGQQQIASRWFANIMILSRDVSKSDQIYLFWIWTKYRSIQKQQMVSRWFADSCQMIFRYNDVIQGYLSKSTFFRSDTELFYRSEAVIPVEVESFAHYTTYLIQYLSHSYIPYISLSIIANNISCFVPHCSCSVLSI